MIRCVALSARAGAFRLREVSLTVPAGAYAVLTGATGAGKTTLLEAIAGALRADAGEIYLNGADVTREPPETRRVGFVYQHGYLFPHLSVRENAAFGARTARAAREADVLLERFGIAALAQRGVNALSGGERQIVALARALASQPRTLLLDEPFGALDRSRRASVRAALRDVLRDVQRERALTTLHVTHDGAEAEEMGEMQLEMAEGTVVT